MIPPPHFKFLFSNERLDLKIKEQKDWQCTFIFTAFFDNIYEGYQQFWPRVCINTYIYTYTHSTAILLGTPVHLFGKTNC